MPKVERRIVGRSAVINGPGSFESGGTRNPIAEQRGEIGLGSDVIVRIGQIDPALDSRREGGGLRPKLLMDDRIQTERRSDSHQQGKG